MKITENWRSLSPVQSLINQQAFSKSFQRLQQFSRSEIIWAVKVSHWLKKLWVRHVKLLGKKSTYNVGLQLFRGEWKATTVYWVPAIWCLLCYLPILLIPQIVTECYAKLLMPRQITLIFIHTIKYWRKFNLFGITMHYTTSNNLIYETILQ